MRDADARRKPNSFLAGFGRRWGLSAWRERRTKVLVAWGAFAALLLMLLAVQELRLARELDRQSLEISREASGSSVRSGSQLQREVLRLMLLVERLGGATQGELTLQRQLVNSRLSILERQGFSRWVEGTELEGRVAALREDWERSAPALDQLAADPNDERASSQALASLAAFEQATNELVKDASGLSIRERGARSEAAMLIHRQSRWLFLGWLVLMALVGLTGLRLFEDRRGALAALGRRERQLRGIFEGTPDGLVLVNEHGLIVAWSPGQERITGLKRAEVIERPAWEVPAYMVGDLGGDMPADHFRANLAQVLETGHAAWMKDPFEITVAHKDGTTRAVQVVAFAIPTAEGFMMGSVQRDVTDLKRVEQAMRHAQRLESLELLAGGVAHDFNNLLTGILGRASLAGDRLEEDHPAVAHLESIELAARRGAELTRQLLVYAGRAPARKEMLDLNDLVSDSMALLETVVSNRAHLQLQLAGALAPVRADPAQLNQVVMNLVLNAADAVDATGLDGAVIVRTCMREVPHEDVPTDFVGSAPLVPGRHLCLSVDDEGIGMDPATLDRLYEPFFSTKDEGRGLGLTTTLGIVRAHGGWLRARARPEGGTSFTLLLPIAQRGAAATASMNEAHPRATGSSPRNLRLLPQRVLVVDDEAHVREVARAILGEAGVETLGANSGTAAIEIYRREGESIDMVLLDVRMPGMDGGQVAETLREIDPAVRVLLFTGHGREDILPVTARLGLGEPLRKPFGVQELLDRLAALMTAEDASAS